MNERQAQLDETFTLLGEVALRLVRCSQLAADVDDDRLRRAVRSAQAGTTRAGVRTATMLARRRARC